MTNNTDNRFAVILPTAGKSQRFGGGVDSSQKKPFLQLLGQPVWTYSAFLFAERLDVSELLIVLAADDQSFFETRFAAELERLRKRLRVVLVDGGNERADSVQNAIDKIGDNVNMVAIHDTARPCVTADAVSTVFAAASEHGAALLASPIVGTVKRAVNLSDGSGSLVETTVPRDNLWEAQTPQVFRRELIVEAYSKRATLFGKTLPTDDAQIIEHLGHDVVLVPSDRSNIKITTPSDLRFAEMVIRSRNAY
jgi:2-C-methyl-D-erythritol 4-phosphate cytidylyltransferase